MQFRYSHIPLTILYSSLNKVFLLLLLAIWRPNTQLSSSDQLLPQYDASNLFSNNVAKTALEMLDDDKLDREWIVRNVLGGMATGFGLRGMLARPSFGVHALMFAFLVVVLDCHPVFTTIIILTGWAVKTALAHLVSGWVGAGIGFGAGSERSERVTEEMWLAYSIP